MMTQISPRFRANWSESPLSASLRKHAYSNILKILPPKKWKCSEKKSDIFNMSAQNIDCGYPLEPPRRGGSNEYPQSMFLRRNKKNNVYPFQPQFYYIKVGFKGGSKLYRLVLVMMKRHVHWHFKILPVRILISLRHADRLIWPKGAHVPKVSFLMLRLMSLFIHCSSSQYLKL